MSGKHRGGWDFSAAAENPAGTFVPPARRRGGRGSVGNRSVPDRIDEGLRTLARGAGELMVTCGAVLLLFVVYEVWVSNLFADHRQAQVHHRLATAWQHGQDPLKGQDRLNLPVGKQVVLPAGQGFANLYIPAFGKDYARTIVQGTSDSDLAAGPGHYVTSQLPGQLGNFAVAGHRVGKGEPFLNLDKLRPGDMIVVQTASNWYVYSVLGNRAAYQAAIRIADRDKQDAAVAAALAKPDSQGVRGREIVSPNAVGVIDPVPNHPQATATRALLTLTTCHPKYSANQRLIVHAQLVRAVPRAGGALPRELPGGTS
ncbi:MAG: sortase [Pseudonocardiales bacterium]|jgi:sortase A|nr:sortase [Pseudonocardiales bacterium]